MIEEQNIQQEELDLTATEEELYLEENLDSDVDALQAVQVHIQKISQRQRQITAQVQIPQPAAKVWEVLTDYEALADFIPNLAKSCRLEHPTGGIRLEQIGCQRLLRFNFSARVILDLEEFFPEKINFQMVEGDFKDFSGSWCLEPYSNGDLMGTYLSYTVKVWPKLTMPVAIIERRLSQDVKLNLMAIYKRLESFSAL
ncbi:SRPBCC family protein [Aetokthonos hydrillicola Thurmond2011]|uniref:SRPBCC family protein n=1 Tax=Aetokthonos hydrillicola Thurmond2011 TaxID=2712845 RepID=A0AAP5MDX0_9CYAN|nr:SRPBCC family protein [Aetokthonos hydrillicola]MBO3457903.1 cyclase [Aetokthonos hydrillicola CCALA 1050]MBW4587390.1 SRPBCC family protein [Aetokthonos hydrillicola CCALA 1050]MDR9899959.1 SRPBCC family protein [Aetokthonos hydrillicola Thurmond2011]